MRYVQMARAPGRVRIILSRVLGGGLAAAAVRLIVFFLGQRDFFYLVGVYSVFHEKGLYFRCQWPEEHPKVDQ